MAADRLLRRVGLGVLVLAALVAAQPVMATGAVDDAERTHGVALGLHFGPEGDYRGFLWEIASTGANSVCLVFNWEMHDVRASEVRRAAVTPDDETVERVVAEARSMGLEVTLLPILRIAERGRGEWRGVLDPADRSAWFASYQAFIVHYAALAERAGVSLLSVGSELGSMEADAEWRDVIAAVRGAYSGRLTYSANWDHVHRTPFWDALDVVGLTAYFELTDGPDVQPSVEELVEAWAPVEAQLSAFAERVDKPVIFTEVGYVSQRGAAWHPWDYTTTEPIDLEAQADLYRALRIRFEDSTWLRGLYVWNWFGEGGSDDDGYTPRNKPAQSVLDDWYGARE